MGSRERRSLTGARTRGGEYDPSDCLKEETISGEDGARGRIRTTDTRIFNPLLYQLSYPGLRFEARERGL